MKNRIIKSALALISLAWSLQATAADTDLFLGNVPAPTTSAPNVLFIIDNTGNWTDPFDAEQDALQAVFESIKARVEDETDNLSINVGLMFFAESGGANAGVGSGGYVRAAVRPMGDTDGEGVLYAQLYKDLIGELHERDDKGNAGAGALAMAEAYHYFAELAPWAGNYKSKADYALNEFINSNGSCCEESHPTWALPRNALDLFDSPRYNSPIAPGSCGKNYIIWISNGPTQDPRSSSVDAYNLLKTAAGGDVDEIPLNPVSSQDNWADEWAHFMADANNDVQITTYTIDVLPGTQRQGRGWTSLLKSMAIKDERYYKVDGTLDEIGDQLVAAINDITGDILAVNSVFASVALPAASNAQSTFLNQVFIGQFRPDADALARWPGNMKQYQIGYKADGASLTMQDADGVSVVHPNTGFLENCARSFWSTADSYWSDALDLGLDSTQYCTAASADSNAPDGPLVEKGAQAQMSRATSPASRTVYTCDPAFASCTTLTDFETDNGDISDSLLNVAATDRADTINWARGEDIDDEDGDPLTNGNMRSSVHGDVIHSRPVALNYNTDDAPQVVVYYSGNEGMLRAINGNRPDDADRIDPTVGGSDVEPGEEIWAFMPPEFYPHINTLRENTEHIKFPASGTSAPATGISKPYGIDGTITAFEGYDPAELDNKKYLFAGMRRGGRSVYAFDVTSITSPQLLWKKGCPNLDNDTDCMAGWTDVGQTWSQINLLYARGYTAAAPGNELKPMLIMGGGYDECEDEDNNVDENNDCSGGTDGDLIYILDANNGSILKTLSTDRAVVGKVTVVPYGQLLGTGTMFAYAADMGGNIYRISGGTTAAPLAIDTTAPADWVIKKIASLGCDTAAATCTANRKFLFGPDVVRVPNSSDQFAIVLGSGDREKPLTNYGAATEVDNYFFALFDHATDAAWLNDEDGVCGSNIICVNALTSVTVEDGVAEGDTLSPKGWRLPLTSGEQVVTGAITAFNVANFSTHRPAQPDEACTSSLGTATAYNLSYKDGQGTTAEFDGGGLPPTPVIGKVIIEIINDDGTITTTTEDVCITCGGDSDGDGTSSIFEVAPTGSGIIWEQPTSRVYWNIQQ